MSTIAEALARRLHAGEKDQQGKDYADHLEAVVGLLLARWPDAPLYAIEGGWLHDAKEHRLATDESLRAAGISEGGTRIVSGMTRLESQTYRQYRDGIANSGDYWLIAVKLCDNLHNSDPSRRIPGSDIVEKRYIPARVALEEGLTRASRPEE